jgi:hypothetical protein
MERHVVPQPHRVLKPTAPATTAPMNAISVCSCGIAFGERYSKGITAVSRLPARNDFFQSPFSGSKRHWDKDEKNNRQTQQLTLC